MQTKHKTLNNSFCELRYMYVFFPSHKLTNAFKFHSFLLSEVSFTDKNCLKIHQWLTFVLGHWYNKILTMYIGIIQSLLKCILISKTIIQTHCCWKSSFFFGSLVILLLCYTWYYKKVKRNVFRISTTHLFLKITCNMNQCDKYECVWLE